MLDTRTRTVAESVFDRNKMREAEINEALKQEEARHEAGRQEHAPLESFALGAKCKINERVDAAL